MELKTLKEIEIMEHPPVIINGDCEDQYKKAYVDTLKEEAIKDIKEIEDFRKSECEDGCCYKGDNLPFYTTEETTEAVIDYIKWKFNLTEEDLA